MVVLATRCATAAQSAVRARSAIPTATIVPSICVHRAHTWCKQRSDTATARRAILTSSSSMATSTVQVTSLEVDHGIQLSLRGFQTSARLQSQGSWAAKGDISYNEVKKLATEPTGEVTMIDVREPEEVSGGMIPSAVNVPLSQFEKAFNPDAGADFQEKFAFPRPEFEAPLVFYCRSGKRSAQAQEFAQRKGWHNSRNYRGSYLDWVQQEERK